MSKIKSPREKKALSLKRDRRNTFGENAKASRKAIPRRKQLSHMQERRAVAQVLGHLRESATEGDAAEADALAKTTLTQSKRKAFKKHRDTALGVVVKEKLVARREQSRPRQVDTTLVRLNFEADGVFDTPYDPTLHKRAILRKLRFRCARPSWGPHEKKSKRYRRRYEREDAARWKEATLRNAPLLAGFFAEEPQWRDRIMRWYEAAANAGLSLTPDLWGLPVKFLYAVPVSRVPKIVTTPRHDLDRTSCSVSLHKIRAISQIYARFMLTNCQTCSMITLGLEMAVQASSGTQF